MSSAEFTPASIPALIADLTDRPESVADLAVHHRTDVVQLNHFLVNSPEIAEAYAAAIARARIAAAAQLPEAVAALHSMLRLFQSEIDRARPDPQSLAVHADTARRAANLLLRIANLTPRPLTARPPAVRQFTPPAPAPSHPAPQHPISHPAPHPTTADPAPPHTPPPTAASADQPIQSQVPPTPLAPPGSHAHPSTPAIPLAVPKASPPPHPSG